MPTHRHANTDFAEGLRRRNRNWGRPVDLGKLQSILYWSEADRLRNMLGQGFLQGSEGVSVAVLSNTLESLDFYCPICFKMTS